MPTLKLPTLPVAPMKPVTYPNQPLEERIRALQKYADDLNLWAISLTRALLAWSRQLDDLFNRGSVKRL